MKVKMLNTNFPYWKKGEIIEMVKTLAGTNSVRSNQVKIGIDYTLLAAPDRRFTKEGLPVLVKDEVHLRRLVNELKEHRTRKLKIEFWDATHRVKISWDRKEHTVEIIHSDNGEEYLYTEDEINDCLNKANPPNTSFNLLEKPLKLTEEKQYEELIFKPEDCWDAKK